MDSLDETGPEPQPRPDLIKQHTDTIAAAYDREAYRFDADHLDAGSQAENRWIAEQLTWWSRGGRVVDLACGTGLLLDLMPSVGAGRYLGIDVSKGMLRVARRKHPGYRFVQDDARFVRGLVQQHLGGYANLVVCLFSLYLMPDPSSILRATEDSLVQGGQVFFTIPTPKHAEAPCDCHRYDPQGYTHWWTLDEAWRSFSAYFHDVDIEPLPSPTRPGEYLAVRGTKRYYRRPNDELIWNGPGEPPGPPA